MRFLRLLFVTLLGLFLILLALANREIVSLTAFPAQFGQYLGGQWSVRMPLFLVLFLAIAFGMLMGLIWEWLREAHLRRESSYRAQQVAKLEREVGHLRDRHVAPRDEVLAIVDGPRPGTPASRPIASAEPAPGTTLPAARQV